MDTQEVRMDVQEVNVYEQQSEAQTVQIDAREVINKYLKAWQKGDRNTLRSLMSNDGRFGGGRFSADGVVDEILRLPAWKDVRLINAVYDDMGNAAIMYEGTDRQTGRTLRSSEFITTSDGKIEGLEALIVGGVAVTGDTRDEWKDFVLGPVGI